MIPKVLFRFDDKTLHRTAYPGPLEFISQTPIWAGEEAVLEVLPNCGIQVRVEGYDFNPADGSLVRCPVYVAGSRRNDSSSEVWGGWDGQTRSSSAGFLKVYGGNAGVKMSYSDGSDARWMPFFTTSLQCILEETETEAVIFAGVRGTTLSYLYDREGRLVLTKAFEHRTEALAFAQTELKESLKYQAGRVFDCSDGWETWVGPVSTGTDVVERTFSSEKASASLQPV